MTPTREQVGNALALYMRREPGITLGIVIIRMRFPHRWFRAFDKIYEQAVWISARNQREAVTNALARMRELYHDCEEFSIVRTEGW